MHDLGKFRKVEAPKVEEPAQLDPNKMYYSEEMLSRDGSQFILELLLANGIVNEQMVKDAKEAFMKAQNDLLLETAKTTPQLRAIILELERQKHNPEAH